MSGAARKVVQMVSPSVEAAKKLPPTIKKQSVTNQLMRGGAKPIELEYSGFSDWLAGQGDRVSSEEVIRHLTERGPMGRLQRLDAQGPSPGFHEDYIDRYGEDPMDEEDEAYKVLRAQRKYDALSEDAKKFTEEPDHMGGVATYNVYPDQSARLPNDPSTTVDTNFGAKRWPHTKYANFTEGPAHGWNEDDYREVYWLDPATENRNKPGRKSIFDPLANPLPVDAHDTDAWVRYHVNQDKNLGEVLDVTNVQSDIGQRVAKAQSRRELPEAKAELLDGYNMHADALENARERTRMDISAYLTNHLDTLRSLEERMVGGGPLEGGDRAVLELRNSLARNNWLPQYRDALMRLWQNHYLTEGGPNPAVLQGLFEDSDRLAAQYRRAKAQADRYSLQLQKAGYVFGGNPGDRAYVSGVRPSALFNDNNWLQLPLRHLVAESLQRGGAPIRLPYATNVRAVENMPRQAAAQFYDRNMVRQLQSILRPMGGGKVVKTPAVGRVYYDSDPTGTGDVSTRSVRVGPEGQRAGTMVIPTEKAVEYAMKYGVPFLSLLTAPALEQNNKKEVR